MHNIHPEYDELRAVGKDLNSELFKELTQDEYIIATRHLGAMKKNKCCLNPMSSLINTRTFALTIYGQERRERSEALSAPTQRHH